MVGYVGGPRGTLVGGEFGEAMILDDYVRAIGLPSGGAGRASLGLASNFADVHPFIGNRRRVHRPHGRPRRPPAAHKLLTRDRQGPSDTAGGNAV
jgi:hypothetical protein